MLCCALVSALQNSIKHDGLCTNSKYAEGGRVQDVTGLS